MTRHEFIRQLTLKLQSEARKGERFTWRATGQTTVYFDFETEEISGEDVLEQLELFLPRIRYTVQLIFPGVRVSVKQRHQHDEYWCLEIDPHGVLWPLNE
jgi:hypothetical protein